MSPDVLEDAFDNLGRIVDADYATKDYAIVVTMNPDPEFLCYGIRNKATLVDEYLTSSLSKARYAIALMQKELVEGYGSATADAGAVSIPKSRSN